MKPMKRKFIPSFDSVFGDQKRYKNENNYEKVAEHHKYPLGSNLRLEHQVKAISSVQNRDLAFNSMIFADFTDKNTQQPTNPAKNSENRVKLKPKPLFHAGKTHEFTLNSSYSTNFSQSSLNFSRSSSLNTLNFANKSQKQLTVPQPFNLSTENRSKHNCMPNNSFEFIARNMPDFSMPFVPKHNEKVFTKPLNINLNTENRADKREIFNEQIKEKNRRNQMIKNFEMQEKEKRDQEEIKMIRKHMEFKANPYVEPSPFIIKPSQNPITVPNPPSLMTENRAFFRSLNN